MDTFLAELRNADLAELQHGSGAILNTEFAAVGSLRLRIIDQIVRNIVDVKLNFSDVLRLQRMSLAVPVYGEAKALRLQHWVASLEQCSDVAQALDACLKDV